MMKVTGGIVNCFINIDLMVHTLGNRHLLPRFRTTSS